VVDTIHPRVIRMLLAANGGWIHRRISLYSRIQEDETSMFGGETGMSSDVVKSTAWWAETGIRMMTLLISDGKSNDLGRGT